jgi:hypothetical protein
MTGNGWVPGPAAQHSGDISAADSRNIIDTALACSCLSYSQNVPAKSSDNKAGTRTGRDCPHLACFPAGLVCSQAKDTGNNPHLRRLGANEAREEDDIVVFGTTPVALWDVSSAKAQPDLLSATPHGRVRGETVSGTCEEMSFAKAK